MTIRPRVLSGALALVLVGFLAACGSSGGSSTTGASSGASSSASSSSSASASSSASSGAAASSSSAGGGGRDVCAYATKEEVAAAIGVAVNLSQPESDTQCGYFPDTPSSSNGFYVEVTDSSAYAALKQTMVRSSPVAGLGEDAFWAAPILRVKAGAKMIVINVMDVTWNGGDSQGAAVNVAQKVLGRL